MQLEKNKVCEQQLKKKKKHILIGKLWIIIYWNVHSDGSYDKIKITWLINKKHPDGEKSYIN